MKGKTFSLAFAAVLLLSGLFGVPPSTRRPYREDGGGDTASGRAITYYWYSFFEYGGGWTDSAVHDVWKARGDVYGEDFFISGDVEADQPAYPHIRIWGPPEGWLGDTWYYTVCRLWVTCRTLTEITIDELGGRLNPNFDPKYNYTHPNPDVTGYLPYNLMGDLEAGVTGGTAKIDWYQQYIDLEQKEELGIADISYDGYVGLLTGTVTMDENATKRILGITDATYGNLESWWTGGGEGKTKDDVTVAWRDWLFSEDTPERADIQSVFGRAFEILGDGLSLDLTYDSAFDKVTIAMEMPGTGFELFLSRWFHETFMPGYQNCYSDITLNMTIGPTSAKLYLDMAVDRAMHMWSARSVPFAHSVWRWEATLGEVRASDSYRYPNGTVKKRICMAPGHELYGQYTPYKYTPAAWSLQEGETLIFDFSSVLDRWLDGDKAWIYTQEPWNETAGETPLDALEVEFGVPYPTLIEPHPEDFPGQILWYKDTVDLEFTGPIDMETWSKENLEAEWLALADSEHPEGLCPWGAPNLELQQIPFFGDDDDDDDDDGGFVLSPELVIALIIVIGLVAVGAAYFAFVGKRLRPRAT